jgi:hypothetical protein
MDFNERIDDVEEKELSNGTISKKGNAVSKSSWFNDYSTPTANEIKYLFQILSIFIVMIAALYNLTTKSGDDSLWTALLTSCLGIMIPTPEIKPRSVLYSA